MKKNNLYTVICSWAGLEIMMETTSSSFNIEFEDYSDFEEKFIKNKFLIKEFLEKNKQI